MSSANVICGICFSIFKIITKFKLFSAWPSDIIVYCDGLNLKKTQIYNDMVVLMYVFYMLRVDLSVFCTTSSGYEIMTCVTV